MDTINGDLSKTIDVEWTFGASDRKRRRRKKGYWHPESVINLVNACILTAFLLFIHGAASFVIAPPWANPQVNPCSKKSWQLIYWPPNDRCYQIFEQGPCPRSQVQMLFTNMLMNNVYFLSFTIIVLNNLHGTFPFETSNIL